jgi:hypothetical protein
MSVPGSVVLVTVPVIVPPPVVGQTWSRRTPLPAYPPQPPSAPVASAPPRNTGPGARRADGASRRILAERREQRPIHY